MINKVNLFCLPCAGGSATFYSKWNKLIDSSIEVIPIELKGRGFRMSEDFYLNFEEMIDDISSLIFSKINNEIPFALLGFSMGALLAYEIYKKLELNGYKEPTHIFFVGREAPKYQYIKIGHLNDNDFLKEIYSYQGIPDEIYKNKDLLDFVLPQLKADFRVYESYCVNTIKKLNCNISILYGEEDKSISHDGLYMWREYANQECNFIKFKGGHFFMKNSLNEVFYYLEAKLLN